MLPRPSTLRCLVLLLLTTGFLTVPALAQDARLAFQYFDAHPIPNAGGGATWCLIEGPHSHDYALDPDQEPVYIMDGTIYYMGDTVLTGAPIEAIWYWGAHPVGHLGGAWCVLDGPHSHYWQPWWRTAGWRSSSWRMRDGYWTWAAGYDDWYHWSYNRWYAPQHSIHVRLLAAPRYAPRYVQSRHPAVVYSTSRRPSSWDYRSSGDRYRQSRTVRSYPSRDSRYGRRSSSGRQ